MEIKEINFEEAEQINNEVPEFDKYSNEYFRERVGLKKSLILGAYVDGKRTGYLIAYDKFEDGSLYCWMAGVVLNFRKNGVLTSLMNFQNNWAKENGYSKVKIKTRNNRREMLAYLVKNGFLFTSVEEKSDIEENRILLEKSLL